MLDQTPFEARLAATYARYAGEVSSDVDPLTLARTILARPGRPPRTLRTWSLARPTVPALLLGLLVVLALAAALVGAVPSRPRTYADAFEATGRLMSARGIGATATTLSDGRVLVVGGRDDKADDTVAEIWDPATGTFSPAGLDEPRSEHTATLLRDGRVLLVGGSPDASTAVWDARTLTFTRTGQPADSRYRHTATLLSDGRVLIIGGQEGDWTHARTLASAEIWDPSSETFTPAGALTEVRSSHTATLLEGGRVLVVGGAHSGTDVATAEVWDPSHSSFGPAGSLDVARTDHTATLLADGRVLVVGGWGNDRGFLLAAELYDPTSGSFTGAGSLAEARIGHTATLLDGGRVLVVGGEDDRGVNGLGTHPYASGELWDPARSSFSAAASLREARTRHMAALLRDGRVLVIAGSRIEGIGDGSLNSAEIYQ